MLSKQRFAAPISPQAAEGVEVASGEEGRDADRAGVLAGDEAGGCCLGRGDELVEQRRGDGGLIREHDEHGIGRWVRRGSRDDPGADRAADALCPVNVLDPLDGQIPDLARDRLRLGPDDDEREDFEVSVSAGVTKTINDWASVRVDYSYTDNNSNVEQSDGSEPYSYDRHVVGVRLITSY